MKNRIPEIRERVAADLEHCLRVYNKKGDWVNKDTCISLIEDLRTGKPVVMEGPFWGDILDGVLHEMGFGENGEIQMEVRALLNSQSK